MIGGLQRIAKFAEIVVPFMAIAYVIGCLIITCANLSQIGPMFAAIFRFAFTTVLGWSQYGSKTVEYLLGAKGVKVYKVIFVLMMVSGAIMEGGLAWDLSDTFNGLMMIPNLIGVLALFPLVIKITANYVDRKIKKKDVAPLLSYDPDLQREAAEALDEE